MIRISAGWDSTGVRSSLVSGYDMLKKYLFLAVSSQTPKGLKYYKFIVQYKFRIVSFWKLTISAKAICKL